LRQNWYQRFFGKKKIVRVPVSNTKEETRARKKRSGYIGDKKNKMIAQSTNTLSQAEWAAQIILSHGLFNSMT